MDIVNERYEIPASLKFAANNLTRAAVAVDLRHLSIETTNDKNIQHGLCKASLKVFKEELGSKRTT
jgi:hypothetical protein